MRIGSDETRAVGVAAAGKACARARRAMRVRHVACPGPGPRQPLPAVPDQDPRPPTPLPPTPLPPTPQNPLGVPPPIDDPRAPSGPGAPVREPAEGEPPAVALAR